MAHYSKVAPDSVLVLRDVGQSLSATFYSGETATDADGSVTIGIVDEAGNTVVASGTSTSKTATGVYAYTLAAQSNLKKLTATWTGTWGTAMSFKTEHSVVGGSYTTPAEIRAMDSIAGESSTFSAEDVVSAISYATRIIDEYCGASFIQKYQRDVLNGTDDDTIKVTQMFPTTLLSASIDGTDLTSDEKNNVALFENGELVRKDKIWEYNQPGNKVIIEYEYGVGTEAPEEIKWCARVLARYHLLEQVSRIPDRAISVQSEFGNIQLAQPGMNRPTPIPDVNVILNRHRHRAPSAF
jgi:hypothetical protein